MRQENSSSLIKCKTQEIYKTSGTFELGAFHFLPSLQVGKRKKMKKRNEEWLVCEYYLMGSDHFARKNYSVGMGIEAM